MFLLKLLTVTTTSATFLLVSGKRSRENRKKNNPQQKLINNYLAQNQISTFQKHKHEEMFVLHLFIMKLDHTDLSITVRCDDSEPAISQDVCNVLWQEEFSCELWYFLGVQDTDKLRLMKTHRSLIIFVVVTQTEGRSWADGSCFLLICSTQSHWSPENVDKLYFWTSWSFITAGPPVSVCRWDEVSPEDISELYEMRGAHLALAPLAV